jgi:hypothetical protein
MTLEQAQQPAPVFVVSYTREQVGAPPRGREVGGDVERGPGRDIFGGVLIDDDLPEDESGGRAARVTCPR